MTKGEGGPRILKWNFGVVTLDTECGLFQGVSREDAETILGAAKEMEKIWKRDGK